MEKAELDEVVDLCARHFVKGMDRKGWLGKIIAENGLDLTGVSDDVIHEILVKTIMKLDDAFKEEIEIEEEEEDFDEDEDEDEDFSEEDEDDEDDEDLG